ncbi:MAG: gluconokinase [Anaerolineales bacterium]|nr:gluconokinase [Anaerolineales bacterium]MCB9143995.1 gluconokinase [Anaerolineales bacterium]
MKALTIVIMGVSGSGKTTIGKILARELGWDFFDADDFHSVENQEKMSKGIPLSDEDRAEWLNALDQLLQNRVELKHPCVLACSALKQKYRDKLAVSKNIQFVYLYGSYEQIETRMKRRKGHYMPVQLLQSQFEALEEPRDAVIVDISVSPEEIVQSILKGIN